MSRLRHTLALPVLVATLLGVALPVPALAEPGQGHGKGQQDRSGYERSSGKRDTYNDRRDNGRGDGGYSERGNSRDKQQSGDSRQRTDDRYDSGRYYGEQPGRGRSDQQRQDPDDRYNNGRNAQQYQSLSPQQAAQRARSQYGGQVLKVQPSGGGYQVRLLKEDGRVVTVPIAD
jgi:hypothetical protein